MLIGRPAIVRAASGPANKVNLINDTLVATESGIITEVRLRVSALTENIYFGIFYEVSPDNFRCRSATGNLGSASGYKAFSVSLACQVGDVIGMYADDTQNYLYYSTSGGSGYHVYSDGSNHCIVDDQKSYTPVANRDASLEGELFDISGGGMGPAGLLIAHVQI